VGLLVSALVLVSGRRYHDNRGKNRHSHTFLELCADDTDVIPHGCIQGVTKKWPTPATLDPMDCKEAARPHNAVGSTDGKCGGALVERNIYHPITIPMGLLHPNLDYRHGSDVDTLTSWDRIRCRDGQLFATGWYRKYTPQECARLCAKISDFYGKSCTHFSRQWMRTKIEEHEDNCGRDGDSGPLAGGQASSYGSAGLGTGSYSFLGQCIFFNSPNNECCATKAAWTEEGGTEGGGTVSGTHCQTKYGDRQDAWDSKHRSWRLKRQAFTPIVAWPVVASGRRLGEVEVHSNRSSELAGHKLIFPNGTSMWVLE